MDDDETVVVGDEKETGSLACVDPGLCRRRLWRSWIPIGVGAEAVNRSRGFFKRNKSENGEKTNGGEARSLFLSGTGRVVSGSSWGPKF